MKRTIILSLTLLLLLSMLSVGAAAAESYVFGYAVEGSQELMVYYGDIPDGDYYVVAVGPDGSIKSTAPVTVVRRWADEIGNYVAIVYPEFLFPGESSPVQLQAVLVWLDGYVAINGVSAEDGCFIILDPVEKSGVGFISAISDVITTDLISGALDQILALLPAALVALIAFIGIRKAIRFLRDFLESR